jgi:hypothetical protein
VREPAQRQRLGGIGERGWMLADNLRRLRERLTDRDGQG